MPLPGRNSEHIRVAKFKRFYAARRGFQYNHSTEATAFGLREDGTLTIKAGNKKDSNDRDIRNHDIAEFTAKLMQTDMPAIQKIIALAKNPHNLWLPSANNDYFNFVENTATPAAPNGSTTMGLHWKLTIGKDDRNLECKWSSRLFKKETEWLYANMSSLGTAGGSSGGSNINLNNGLVYDRSKYRESSFTDVTVDGISVGELGGSTKIEIESKPWTTIKDQEIMQFVTAKCEIEMGQSATEELQAVIDNAEQDLDVIFYTPSGETFEFINGAVTTSPEFTHSDKEAMIKLMVNGEIAHTLITFPSATRMVMDFAG